MAADTLTPVVEYLCRAATPPSAGLSDGELLERFAGRRDQAAFAALVRRHGPMVMGVCRRLLRDRHEAEDAWQATFLVLVRKAGAIARRDLLAGWLYGVAYRTANRARVVAARRRARERPAEDVTAAGRPNEDWPDLRPILDEEIRRLPEKYRLPVILCYFESKTHAEAARLLNCPRCTVATRLARARERLRVSLTRRGVALPAGGLTLLLAREATQAAVPGLLAAATVRAGGALAAAVPAAGGASTQAIILSQGVMPMVTVTKLRAVLAVLLTAGVAGSGLGLAGLRMRAAEAPTHPPEPKAEGKPALPAASPTKADAANLEERIYAALRKDRCWKSTDLHCAVWVRDLKDNVLVDALFKRYDADGIAEVITRAREGEIHVDPGQNKLRILLRKVYVKAQAMKHGWAFFEDREWTVPLPPAPNAKTGRRLEKPREDAAINLLNFKVPFSLMGERLDPPGRMSLSCESFAINDYQSITVRGSVRATQGVARLECDELQVFVDQPIQTISEMINRELKEFRCRQNVRLEERLRDGPRLVHFSRLAAPTATIHGQTGERAVDAERKNGHTYLVTIGSAEGGVRADGPGVFDDLHESPSAGAEEILTLWRISYKGRANISPKDGRIRFRGQVEAACVPGGDPDSVIDPDKLPDGAITFRGGEVTFEGQKSAKARAGRQLIIHDEAVFRTAELWGQADTITYDEDAGRVVLQGDGTTGAVVIRAGKYGGAPERITGRRILYRIKTGHFDVEQSGGSSVAP